MDRARSAVQYMAVISLAAACVYAIYGVLYPPFSDSEIKASIVDTWQAHALFTFAMFVAIAVIAMASLAFRFGSVDRVVRRLNIVAFSVIHRVYRASFVQPRCANGAHYADNWPDV